MSGVLGAGTSGTSSPSELVTWAFNNAWTVASTKATNADSMFSNALSGAGSAPQVGSSYPGFTPTVVEPPVTIPTDAQSAGVASFYELSQAVIDQLADLFASYMQTYFPDETPYLHDAEQWLVKALTEGGTGIAPAVERQIWERDRDRLLKDSLRAENEAYSTWAARRYPLPPGALAGQIAQIRREASDKIAESSRSLAVKQMEIEVENVKFAVDKAITLYSAAMGAAVDYVRALAVGPTSSMQIIPSVTDSQSKLIQAANSYYTSRIAVEELRMKAGVSKADFELKADTTSAQLTMEDIKNRVMAAVEAAKAMSTQAAAALNALHAQASISGGGATNVQYSYSNDTTTSVPPLASI